MSELVIMEAPAAGWPLVWELSIRREGERVFHYEHVCFVDDEMAVRLVAAGAPKWQNGPPDWVAHGNARHSKEIADLIEKVRNLTMTDEERREQTVSYVWAFLTDESRQQLTRDDIRQLVDEHAEKKAGEGAR